jgi:hypothetical protein
MAQSRLPNHVEIEWEENWIAVHLVGKNATILQINPMIGQ